MIFNINDTVRVQLTQKGKNILRERYDNYAKSLGEIFPPKSFELPKEDDNGFSEWQMWQLFEYFGSNIFLGCELPFNTNIEIPISETDK